MFIMQTASLIEVGNGEKEGVFTMMLHQIRKEIIGYLFF